MVSVKNAAELFECFALYFSFTRSGPHRSFPSWLAEENIMEFSFKRWIHAGVYEGINGIGEVKEKHTEQFNVSWHPGNKMKPAQNNDNPKW